MKQLRQGLSIALCVAVLSACGGGSASSGSSPVVPAPPTVEPPPQPEPPTEPEVLFSVTGHINVSTEATVDSDTNNPDNNSFDNSVLAQAQPLPNPSAAGGYLAEVGAGESGEISETGDLSDYYAFDGFEGQQLSIVIGDPQAADIDLYLYDEAGDLISSSTGTSEREQVFIPSDGRFFIEVFLFGGASNYILTAGNSGTNTMGVTAQELIVEYEAESILKLTVSEARRHAVAHRFGLIEVAGGLGRERLMQAGPMNTTLLSPRLLTIRDRLQRDPEHLAQWETWMLAKALSTQIGVARATPNFRVRTLVTANDELFNLQWQYPAIKLLSAWDTSIGDPSVIVAVIDTGVVLDHPDLLGQWVDGYDFIRDAEAALDGDGLDDNPTDEGLTEFRAVYHGTHVAGSIAARGNNRLGVAGVAYASKIMPLRTLTEDEDNSGNTYDLIQAIRYAAGLSNDANQLPQRPADIINLSLGFDGPIPSIENLINTITDRGVIVIAASGNESASQVTYPAAYDNVFAVGATDLEGRVTSYSNTGSALDLVAPGGDMRVDLNGDGYPDGILSTGMNGNTPAYTFLEGTSMATPHVAGVFALMKAVNPELSPFDLKALLSQGALTDDIGDNGRDDESGWGLINAQKAVNAALDSIGSTIDRPPLLTISSTQLNFGSARSQLEVQLTNGGEGDLMVTAANSDSGWLSASAANAESSGLGSWLINVDRSGLSAGGYLGKITFESSANTLTLSALIRIASGVTGDVGTLYVLLWDPVTDSLAAQELAEPDQDYRFNFSEVPQGRYEIWVGTDNDNDFVICDEGEACGAWRTVESPALLDVDADLSDIELSADYLIALPVINNAALSTTISGNSVKTPVFVKPRQQ